MPLEKNHSLNFEDFVPNFLKNSSLYYLIITDLDGHYRYVNERFIQKFGYISDDFLKETSLVAIHPLDHEACYQVVNKCIAHPHEPHQVLLRKPLDGDQEYVWSQWEFSMILREEKEPVGILCIGHDITESERAIIRARELAKSVDVILEEISDGFLQIGAGMEFRRVNTKFERYFGLSRVEVLGKSTQEYLPALLGESTYSRLTTCLATKSMAVFESQLGTQERWGAFTVYPSAVGLTVFVRDITEERKNQAKMKFTEAKLKAIFDSTVDSNLLIGLEGEILNFNRIADEVAKKTRGKNLVIGAPIVDYLQEDGVRGFTENFPKAKSGQRIVVEVSRSLEDGAHWFEVSYFPVYDGSEDLIGVAMNIRDIDARKKAEIELEQSRQMLKAIYNSSSEGWTFIDQDLKIRFTNKVAKRISRKFFGREPQLEDCFMDYVPPEWRGEFKTYVTRVLQGEKITSVRKVKEEWWETTLEPVFLNDQDEIIGFSSIIKDITELKKREEHILTQNELLKEITWHQSHGLRRHVANILALCDLLNNHTADFEEDRERFIDFIFQESKSMDEVIHKIVNLASRENLNFAGFG